LSSDHDTCHCGHDHGPRHIYIYSPSSAVRDKAAFRRGVKRLQALGHEVTPVLPATTPHAWRPSTARQRAAPMWR
jgi:muramoyltetrapeptide carboxypeptidase